MVLVCRVGPRRLDLIMGTDVATMAVNTVVPVLVSIATETAKGALYSTAGGTVRRSTQGLGLGRVHCIAMY